VLTSCSPTSVRRRPTIVRGPPDATLSPCPAASASRTAVGLATLRRSLSLSGLDAAEPAASNGAPATPRRAWSLRGPLDAAEPLHHSAASSAVQATPPRTWSLRGTGAVGDSCARVEKATTIAAPMVTATAVTPLPAPPPAPPQATPPPAEATLNAGSSPGQSPSEVRVLTSCSPTSVRRRPTIGRGQRRDRRRSRLAARDNRRLSTTLRRDARRSHGVVQSTLLSILSPVPREANVAPGFSDDDVQLLPGPGHIAASSTGTSRDDGCHGRLLAPFPFPLRPPPVPAQPPLEPQQRSVCFFASEVAALAGLHCYSPALQALVRCWLRHDRASLRSWERRTGGAELPERIFARHANARVHAAVRAAVVTGDGSLPKQAQARIEEAVRVSGAPPELWQVVSDEALGKARRGRGTRLESTGLDAYERRYGRMVVRRNKDGLRRVFGAGAGLFAVSGRVDGFEEVAGERWVVEHKRRQRKLLDRIPRYEQVQCQTYMQMTGTAACRWVQTFGAQVDARPLARCPKRWACVLGRLGATARLLRRLCCGAFLPPAAELAAVQQAGWQDCPPWPDSPLPVAADGESAVVGGVPRLTGSPRTTPAVSEKDVEVEVLACRPAATPSCIVVDSAKNDSAQLASLGQLADEVVSADGAAPADEAALAGELAQRLMEEGARGHEGGATGVGSGVTGKADEEIRCRFVEEMPSLIGPAAAGAALATLLDSPSPKALPAAGLAPATLLEESFASGGGTALDEDEDEDDDDDGGGLAAEGGDDAGATMHDTSSGDEDEVPTGPRASVCSVSPGVAPPSTELEEDEEESEPAGRHPATLGLLSPGPEGLGSLFDTVCTAVAATGEC